MAWFAGQLNNGTRCYLTKICPNCLRFRVPKRVTIFSGPVRLKFLSARLSPYHLYALVMKLFRYVLFLAAAAACSQPAAAQVDPVRFGLGFNTMVSSADGLGIGVRGRGSIPVNADVSAAADLGITGFVLKGRRNADYILDPQLSAIIMLPTSQTHANYVLFGVGGYLPVGGDDDGGPTIHFGFGRARALQESSFFYEINPALVIGRDHVDVAVPLRIGIIF